MSTALSQGVDPEWSSELLDALKSVGEGDTRVLDAEISLSTDGAEDSPNHLSVLLYLPRPASPDGWDVEKTQLLKRHARELAVELTTGRLPFATGLPAISLTTKLALTKDVAQEERPQDGEGGAAESGN